MAAGGEVLGAKVREQLAGKLNVEITVSGTVFGRVVGAEIDEQGGTTDVNMEIDTIGAGGAAIGAIVGADDDDS